MSPPSTPSPDPDDLGNTHPTLSSQISHAAQLSYWTSQTADITGMLGGYPQVSRIDLQGSKNFVKKVARLSRRAGGGGGGTSTSTPNATGKARASGTSIDDPRKPHKLPLAIDCGAGIGRITAGLLWTSPATVDIVEPVPKFTNELRKLSVKPEQGHIGQIFNEGLETWRPPEGRKYDLVWNQWCLGHLTDEQVVAYLGRVSGALAGYGGEDIDEGQGWIMVKENLSTDEMGEDLFDDTDSSVTRSDVKFKQLFEEAGLRIVRMEIQSGFPKSLYPVKMYALKPK